MRENGRIVSYTAEKIEAMRARGEDKTDWARVDAKTEADLAADTASDEAWNGIPDDWVTRAQAVTGVLRRPKENKRQVTARLDPDVLEYFRRQGRGWQGRMNAVLRSFCAASWSIASNRAEPRRLREAYAACDECSSRAASSDRMRRSTATVDA